jgi:hypothetical protein
MATKTIRDEDLKVGDVVVILGGEVRVVAIEPYTGPLEEVFAIARTAPKRDFSLVHGCETQVSS